MAEQIPEQESSQSSAASSEEPIIDNSNGLFTSIINEIIYSPLNLVLVALIAFIIYKIIKSRNDTSHIGGNTGPPEPKLPKLRKDFTVQELRKFDGNQPDGRILVAVNGTVYDVTKGKRFYGPGGAYAAFGGRDASRGLATFSVVSSDDDKYDDLSDLNTMEMDSVREWEMQFKEKYELVGRLLKPGEEPSSYSDEEEDKSAGAAAGGGVDGGSITSGGEKPKDE